MQHVYTRITLANTVWCFAQRWMFFFSLSDVIMIIHVFRYLPTVQKICSLSRLFWQLADQDSLPGQSSLYLHPPYSQTPDRHIVDLV